MENSIVFPQNLKIELLYDLAILRLGAYPKESKSESGREMWASIFTEAYSQQQNVHNSKATVHQWTDTQNTEYTWSELLFCLENNKKDVSDLPQHGWSWRPFGWVKSASHKKANTVWFHLDEALKVVKIINTENRMIAARGLGEEIRGVRVSWRQSFGFTRWRRSGDGERGRPHMMNAFVSLSSKYT